MTMRPKSLAVGLAALAWRGRGSSMAQAALGDEHRERCTGNGSSSETLDLIVAAEQLRLRTSWASP